MRTYTYNMLKPIPELPLPAFLMDQSAFRAKRYANSRHRGILQYSFIRETMLLQQTLKSIACAVGVACVAMLTKLHNDMVTDAEDDYGRAVSQLNKPGCE